MTRDEGAIVLGWMTKLFLVVAVLGFLTYDVAAVATANFSTSDRANTLASEAADEVKALKDVNKAYSLIRAEAELSGDTLAPQDFRVASDGHVTIVLHHEASSLWIQHVGPLRHFLDVKATGEGAPAS